MSWDFPASISTLIRSHIYAHKKDAGIELPKQGTWGVISCRMGHRMAHLSTFAQREIANIVKAEHLSHERTMQNDILGRCTQIYLGRWSREPTTLNLQHNTDNTTIDDRTTTIKKNIILGSDWGRSSSWRQASRCLTMSSMTARRVLTWESWSMSLS